MKILLVRPKPSSETIGLQHVMVVEPLELEILAALKRSHDEVFLADLILEKQPIEYYYKKFNPDVICYTGYITNVGTILEYCRQAKQIIPNVTTIVGGVHCEVCPEDFLDASVDYRFVRNAGVDFTELLNHLEFGTAIPKGVLIKNEEFIPEKLPPFDFHMPFPDRSLTAQYRDRYFYIFQDKVALIKTSFGCPYTCSFCFCREITCGKYFQRPMDEVIAELESIKEKEVYIVDDDFLYDKKRMFNFIEELKLRNIKKNFLVYGRADFIACNEDVIRSLKEVGLQTVIVGFESFSEAELENYGKKIALENNRKAMYVLNRYKIDCFATIILSPEWSKADFKFMVKEVKKLGIHFVNLQPLTPLPKCGIQFPDERMLIKKEEYEKWDLAHVTVKPSQLSTADFYREILRSYTSIVFTPKAIIKYLRKYKLGMLLKMISGTRKVTKQYNLKIKQAENA